jgi:hypothetical protein
MYIDKKKKNPLKFKKKRKQQREYIYGLALPDQIASGLEVLITSRSVCP